MKLFTLRPSYRKPNVVEIVSAREDFSSDEYSELGSSIIYMTDEILYCLLIRHQTSVVVEVDFPESVLLEPSNAG